MVVLIVADDVLHEEMILEGGHIQVHHLKSPCDQVIDLNSIVEAFGDNFSVSFPCEIKEAVLFRAFNGVVEIKIEILVHGKGCDCCNRVDILMRLVLFL